MIGKTSKHSSSFKNRASYVYGTEHEIEAIDSDKQAKSIFHVVLSLQPGESLTADQLIE
jgi:hypothetical protein